MVRKKGKDVIVEEGSDSRNKRACVRAAEKRKSVKLMLNRIASEETSDDERVTNEKDNSSTAVDEDFQVELHHSPIRPSASGSAPIREDDAGSQNVGGGGPEDTTLLNSFKFHIVTSICDMKEERGPLRCISHWRKLREWKIEDEPEEVVERVKQSGLYNIINHSYGWMDIVTISAFVERWQPETNSFHMPFGELTITLDDVAQILQIPVVGTILSFEGGGRHIENENLLNLILEELGIEKEVSEEETMGTYTVRLNWLKEQFMGKVIVDSAAGDFDKGGMETMKEKAWGMAILAYLYRQLGLASRSSVKQISGCLSLLIAWIYDHFPMIPNASPDPSYDNSKPRLCKWKNTQLGGDPAYDLIRLREQLDSLTDHDVVWNPYTGIRDRYPLHESSFYSGILLCFDIGEAYFPNRVLRQFDLIQKIPNPPPKPPMNPIACRRGATFNQYKVRYDNGYWMAQSWEDHLLSSSSRCTPVVHPWDCEKTYMDWYLRVSHLIIQNPCARITSLGRQPDDSKSSKLLFVQKQRLNSDG